MDLKIQKVEFETGEQNVAGSSTKYEVHQLTESQTLSANADLER